MRNYIKFLLRSLNVHPQFVYVSQHRQEAGCGPASVHRPHLEERQMQDYHTYLITNIDSNNMSSAQKNVVRNTAQFPKSASVPIPVELL